MVLITVWLCHFNPAKTRIDQTIFSKGLTGIYFFKHDNIIHVQFQGQKLFSQA